MVGGSLTSSARAGAADISESEVKTAVESASIRRIMFPPIGFALRNFVLVGWDPSSQHRDDVRALNAQVRARNRQIVADKSLTSDTHFRIRQSQSPVLRQQRHQA